MVLSGEGHDGTRGLTEVAKHGGVRIVQSPSDSQRPQMPSSAVLDDHPNYVEMVDDIPPDGRLSAPRPEARKLEEQAMNTAQSEAAVANLGCAFGRPAVTGREFGGAAPVCILLGRCDNASLGERQRRSSVEVEWPCARHERPVSREF